MSANFTGASKLKEPRDVTGMVMLEQRDAVFRGNYSFVYTGRYYGMRVAVKVIKLTGTADSMKRKLTRECMVWATVEHPNIQPFYGVDRSEAFNPFGALISPWFANGDASRFLEENGEAMSVSGRINLWKGVIQGLAYLHGHNPVIVHGDLKPGNVLIDDAGNPRICDFGLAQVLMEGHSGLTTTSEHTGTERYLAPELVMSDQSVSPTIASDMYAIGCLGLEFIYLQRPYSHRSNYPRGIVYMDIRNGVPPAIQQPRREWPSCRAWRLILALWHHNPLYRPAAVTMADMLQRLAFTLPPKVLQRIAFFSSNKGRPYYADRRNTSYQPLLSLCLVSKTLHTCAVPLLYEEILLWLGGDDASPLKLLETLNNTRGQSLNYECTTKNGYGGHTKRLILLIPYEAPLPERLTEVCDLLSRMPMLQYLGISDPRRPFSSIPSCSLSTMEVHQNWGPFVQAHYFTLLPILSHLQRIFIVVLDVTARNIPLGRIASFHILLPNLWRLEVTLSSPTVRTIWPEETMGGGLLGIISRWAMPCLAHFVLDVVFYTMKTKEYLFDLLNANRHLRYLKLDLSGAGGVRSNDMDNVLSICSNLRQLDMELFRPTRPFKFPSHANLEKLSAVFHGISLAEVKGDLPRLQSRLQRSLFPKLDIMELAWRSFEEEMASIWVIDGMVVIQEEGIILKQYPFA